MKAFIQHESRGRLRVRMHQYRMSLEHFRDILCVIPFAFSRFW